MISISSKTVSKINKIGIVFLIVYSLGFVVYKAGLYYKTYFEKEKLTNELQIKINETTELKRKVAESKAKIEKVEKSYITKEELEHKVKDVFNRMSLLDYQLNYLDAKKMCIDRYVIIAQVTAQSEEGLQAAQGILGYIGQIKKHEKNDTIYFVDYISKPRQIK